MKAELTLNPDGTYIVRGDSEACLAIKNGLNPGPQGSVDVEAVIDAVTSFYTRKEDRNFAAQVARNTLDNLLAGAPVGGEEPSIVELTKSSAYTCNFCGEPGDKVKYIITGPMVNICNGCVDICNHLIAEADEKSPAPAIPGLQEAIDVVAEYQQLRQRCGFTKKITQHISVVLEAARRYAALPHCPDGDSLRVIPAKKLFNADQASGFYCALDLISGKKTVDDIPEQPIAATESTRADLAPQAGSVDVEALRNFLNMVADDDTPWESMKGRCMEFRTMAGLLRAHLASRNLLAGAPVGGDRPAIPGLQEAIAVLREEISVMENIITRNLEGNNKKTRRKLEQWKALYEAARQSGVPELLERVEKEYPGLQWELSNGCEGLGENPDDAYAFEIYASPIRHGVGPTPQKAIECVINKLRETPPGVEAAKTIQLARDGRD